MTCFIHRWHITACLDTNRPLGLRTRRHLEKCPPCGEFLAAQQALDRQWPTRSEAEPVPALSPALRARILADVQAAGHAPSSLRRPLPGLAWAATAVVVAGLGTLLLLVLPDDRPRDPTSGGGPLPAPAQAWPSPLAALTAPADCAGQVVSTPYDEEWQAIAADARRAVAFLADCASPLPGGQAVPAP
ncbi:MAG: hypothetical protein BWZ02_00172 [Lentisphaerae bacterium ADurb.BinA184]|nr:MAG: hypothetical protein BWZ02_00172 [Lentisphaerae bacterium ADurb.BinA184]